jgi:nitrate/nitrite-specific signal transduction histidine kinase
MAPGGQPYTIWFAARAAPHGRHLSHDQQQLVDTLVEQLTATLALDRHQEHLQQMMVMEERATIARELHDSIAQSLLYEDAGQLFADAGRRPA